jgi:TP53 regulating kinase and related kinases
MLFQGAEARVSSCDLSGIECVKKERFSKSYRLPELDTQIRNRRMSQEVRSLLRCRQVGIRTPVVFLVDDTSQTIYMEKIRGLTLRTWLDGSPSSTEMQNAAEALGVLVAKLHQIPLIHGDLTTSNVMIADETSSSSGNNLLSSLVMIDFGLSHVSALTEDRAVDLYVLERAFLATHPHLNTMFTAIIASYVRAMGSGGRVIQSRLDEVRARGRKKSMVG